MELHWKKAKSLSEAGFPLESLMGSWYVNASTLPLWRDKKNVTITYTAKEGTPISEGFHDLVRYSKQSDAAGKSPSTIEGWDTCLDQSLSWKWRGCGWLMIASSCWRLVGFQFEGENEWLLSYFESTLFTPAGMDILTRKPDGLTSELFETIKSKLAETGDEKLVKFIKEFHVVPNEA